MTIQIQEENYSIKYTLRALFIYEKITGKTFKMETSLDQYIFFYCLALANNPDKPLTFETFINACDNSPKIVADFQKLLMDELQQQAAFMNDGQGEIKKKK
jgi:hypothetical protein